MITFSQIGWYGRLGNQLFQYAILFVVGKKNNYEIRIPEYYDRNWDNQKCLLDNFNITAKSTNQYDEIKYLYKEKKEYCCRYAPEVFNIPDNTDLLGFFQNYQYYKNYEDILIKELTPNIENIVRCTKILDEIKSKYNGYEIVSLHLRRGDTNYTAYSDRNTTNLSQNSVWYKYFSECKKLFKDKKVKYFVFTGGNKTDDNNIDNYEWCKQNLTGSEFIYHDYNKTTMNDFTLMYLCDHHILAMGSTLSWWVGFLNMKKENKLILAPKNYHVNNILDMGFYPDNFIII